jgi:phosphatidate cytidylyltransferase
MHRKRVVVAAILVPFFYFYITYLPPQYFLLLLTVISSAALAEFYAMSSVGGFLKYAGIICGGALLVTFFFFPAHFFTTMAVSLLLLLTMRLFLKRDPGSSLAELSALALGLLYIPGLLTVQLNLIRNGPPWVFLLYASVWSADSMAYYVGKGIGRHKLYVEISPNKTVEGAFGSILGGVLGALIIQQLFMPGLSFFRTTLIGVVVGATTIVGDLVESMFKRDRGVKDSSHILPGHGGVLDKIDGVTFAGPVFYWLCLGLGLLQ